MSGAVGCQSVCSSYSVIECDQFCSPHKYSVISSTFFEDFMRKSYIYIIFTLPLPL